MDGFQPNLPSPIRSLNRIIDKYIKPEIPYLSKRYTVALLTFLGFVISCGTQIIEPNVKFSFNDNNYHFEVPDEITLPIVQCNKNHTNSVKFTGVFQEINWNYLGQITGGILAYMYPAQKVFGIAIALQTVLNFFHAISFKDCVVFETVRIIQAFFKFVAYVACVGIWRHWASLQDRSCLLAISYCGTQVGLLISGYLSKIAWTVNIDATRFCMHGIIGFFWFLIWSWLVFEKPRDHPSISETELKYIETSLKTANDSSAQPSLSNNNPWKQTLVSKLVYVFTYIYCCQLSDYVEVFKSYKEMYSMYFLEVMTELLKVLNLNLISSIVIMLFVGVLADIVKNFSSMSVTNVRKLFITVLVIAECLFCCYYLFSTNSSSLIRPDFNGAFHLMFNISCLDVAPKYATLMMSISSVIFFIKRLLLNLIISLQFYDDEIITEVWTVIIYVTSIMFYLKLPSSDGELRSEESNANEHLAVKNESVNLHELSADKNASSVISSTTRELRENNNHE